MLACLFVCLLVCLFVCLFVCNWLNLFWLFPKKRDPELDTKKEFLTFTHRASVQLSFHTNASIPVLWVDPNIPRGYWWNED